MPSCWPLSNSADLSPGYSGDVCEVRSLLRSTTLPLSASSGRADGSWPMTTLGSVPDLMAATSLVVVSSALAMYWPWTLMSLCVALKCDTSQLISAWLLEDQNVMVCGLPDEAALDDDDEEELQAAAVSASSAAPATARGRLGTDLGNRTVTSNFVYRT